MVADSGRPVIVMAHCGFDADWWIAEDLAAFYQSRQALQCDRLFPWA